MPVSMSSAEPTPSPSANADSLITWHTIRASTPAGAGCTRSVCRPRLLEGLLAGLAGDLDQGERHDRVERLAVHGAAEPLHDDLRAALARGERAQRISHWPAASHDRVAAARGRVRVGGPMRALSAVVVVAAPGLAPVQPGCDLARLDRGGAPARLAEAQLVEALGDVKAGVHADEIAELERPHAEAAAEAHDAVDGLHVRDPLLQQAQRLQAKRAVAAVHDEAGHVGRADHVLAHREAGRLARSPVRARRRARRRSPQAGASAAPG